MSAAPHARRLLDGSNATPESLFKNDAAVWKARAEDIIRAKDLPDATSEEKTND